MMAADWPHLRVLFLRATRASLTQSVLVTYEQEILPADGMAWISEGASRQFRTRYLYPNGSEVVLGGLDRNPSRILSTSWDIVYANECIELTEEVWETLVSRMSRPGRNSLFGWLIGDTNPGAPTHWLKRRCDAGKTALWATTHEANPAMWDGRNWTAAGLLYLERLEQLTGVRYLRLRKGIWAGVEGQVYDEWDEAVHLIDPFEIPGSWPRFRSIDFGYNHAFVCQWWARDNDGRLYLYRELYGTHRLVADWAKLILKHSEGERIEWTVADHDAEDRATLEAAHIKTVAASKDVKPGIEAVQLRLRRAGDGKPRLFILKGCRVEADPRLIEARKPTCTAEEIGGYIWAPALPNRPPKEEPQKMNDDGVDAMRYMVLRFAKPRLPVAFRL